MFDFHQDKIRYFNIQKTVTAEDIIPFIERHYGPVTGKHVIEIGCAEAGVLKAFIEHGNTGVGVELSSSRFDQATAFLAKEIAENKAQIINKNIYDIDNPVTEFGRLFDVIILKDVIEHIPDQEKFIPKLKEFLADDGVIFFAYPPWWMPFGGHQQICRHKILRTLPWFHLLPLSLYTLIVKKCNRQSFRQLKELIRFGLPGIRTRMLLKICTKKSFMNYLV